MAEKRIAEAAKLGFKRCIVPMANMKEASRIKGISIEYAQSVKELLDKVL
jgi:DNA repair protein RadA/Sms